MELTVRPIVESEVLAFRQKLIRAFGGDPQEDDSRRFLKVMDLERTVSAFDGDELVGTCAAFTLEVTVPGGTLPMGGTTMVTVQATHRRRGVLRAMMRAHLDEIRQRGEPLAGLWASESSIYGRFGYGLAAEGCETRLDGRLIEFAGDPPPGTVSLVEPDAARAILPAVYEQVRLARPGMLGRTAAWWECRILHDPEHWRHGRSAKRFAVSRGPGGFDGYAIYRQKEKWDDFPEGEVYVLEVMASGGSAHETIWRYLTRIDLFPMVRYWNLPVDDALPWRITEGRRVQRSVTDSLWLRLMDIPRALAGRAYGGQGRLVLGVHDHFLSDNDGRYELETAGGEATCRRTNAAPDVEIQVDALGALYLGAHRFTTLARAGLIRGSDEALARGDQLFAWSPAPWCPEDF